MGDPLPDSYSPPVPGRRRRRDLVLPVLVLATLAFSGFNTAIIFGVVGPTQFNGSSLFSVSVQYQYGASPGGSVLLPGDFATFTLTVSNNARLPSNLAIFFQATNPEDGQWTCYDGAATFPGTFTMTLSGQSQPVSPSNSQSPHNCFGSVPRATFTMQPGTNTITGRIDVSSTATVGSSFTLDWFGQPV